MTRKIKVAIIEDIKEVAEILKENINSCEDMFCENVYHSAEDAMLFLKQKDDVDVVIVDIGLPRASGIEAIKYLSEFCPNTQYCMFTVHEEDNKIFDSLQNGAKGYILKNSPKEKILDAIRELHNGGSPMTSSIARRIIDVFQKVQINPITNILPLTNREQELLTLLSKGHLYKEISDMLGITVGTVKQHIHKIYEKLQVSNKVEAINKMNGS